MEVILKMYEEAIHASHPWYFEITQGRGRKRVGNGFSYSCPIKAVEAGNRALRLINKESNHD